MLMMESSNMDQDYGRKVDEISVKKLLLTIKEYVLLVTRRWYLLLLGMMVLGGLQFYNFYKIKPTYPAKIVFLVRAQDVVNENKHMIKIYSRLINSRGLLEKLLLDPIEGNASNTLLINEYLNVYFLHKPEGLSDDIPYGFQFENNQIQNLSADERKVFQLIVEKVVTPMSDYTDGFVNIETDEEVGFITVNVSGPTEEFSLLLLDQLSKKAEQLLTENTIFAPKIAYDNLKGETDSLARRCTNMYYELNKYKSLLAKVKVDDSYNISRIEGIENKIYQLEGDTEICQAKYLAASKELKGAQVAMDQKTLLIQQLERTYAPIEPYKPSKIVAAVKGAVMGASLIIFAIILLRIYRNIAAELA